MWPGTVLEAETQWWMRSRLPPKRTEKKKRESQQIKNNYKPMGEHWLTEMVQKC